MKLGTDFCAAATGLLAALAMAPLALAQEPGSIISDCHDCPDIVVVPPGEFTMGWDGAEPVREGEIRRYEGPERLVSIEKPFGLGRFEVTNRQFAAFIEATGHEPTQGCYAWDGWTAEFIDALDWIDPGYGRPPLPTEPVACVSWVDAHAYTEWLSEITGERYRLPTEAEWEYAARAGAQGDFTWGEDDARACEYANVFDISAQNLHPEAPIKAARCDDGHAQLAAVGSFKANAFGLYDMSGNVWEWNFDCYEMPYPADAPTDGSAVITETCDRRSVKGGSWMTSVERQRFTFRGRDPETLYSQVFGFRVARDVEAD